MKILLKITICFMSMLCLRNAYGVMGYKDNNNNMNEGIRLNFDHGYSYMDNTVKRTNNYSRKCRYRRCGVCIPQKDDAYGFGDAYGYQPDYQNLPVPIGRTW